jgi:hypothetical protein
MAGQREITISVRFVDFAGSLCRVIIDLRVCAALEAVSKPIDPSVGRETPECAVSRRSRPAMDGQERQRSI